MIKKYEDIKGVFVGRMVSKHRSLSRVKVDLVIKNYFSFLKERLKTMDKMDFTILNIGWFRLKKPALLESLPFLREKYLRLEEELKKIENPSDKELQNLTRLKAYISELVSVIPDIYDYYENGTFIGPGKMKRKKREEEFAKLINDRERDENEGEEEDSEIELPLVMQRLEFMKYVLTSPDYEIFRDPSKVYGEKFVEGEGFRFMPYEPHIPKLVYTDEKVEKLNAAAKRNYARKLKFEERLIQQGYQPREKEDFRRARKRRHDPYKGIPKEEKKKIFEKKRALRKLQAIEEEKFQRELNEKRILWAQLLKETNERAEAIAKGEYIDAQLKLIKVGRGRKKKRKS